MGVHFWKQVCMGKLLRPNACLKRTTKMCFISTISAPKLTSGVCALKLSVSSELLLLSALNDVVKKSSSFFSSGWVCSEPESKWSYHKNYKMCTHGQLQVRQSKQILDLLIHKTSQTKQKGGNSDKKLFSHERHKWSITNTQNRKYDVMQRKLTNINFNWIHKKIKLFI